MRIIIQTITTLVWIATMCSSAIGGNFVGVAVNTPPEFIEAAERARIHSAEYWTGKRLPNWADDCEIRWKQTSGSAGGAAHFSFIDGEVTGWSLDLQGPFNAVLRDVIPHEVDHMVRASIVRRRIPRLLDEGAACMFERGDDWDEYVKSFERAADVPAMWASLDADSYPDGDVGPFYGFGVSLTRFLILNHGKEKTLELMRGRPSERWQDILGESIEDTQQAWITYFRGQIRKPVIRLISTEYCPPCKQFWREYQAHAPALPYVVVKESWTPLSGVLKVPTFIAPDGAKAVGYRYGWANWDKWARSHIPSGNTRATWEPSRDTGPLAVAESVPSTQGAKQDAQTQPAAGEIEQYERTDQKAQPPPNTPPTESSPDANGESQGAPERTVTPAAPPGSDLSGSETAGTVEDVSATPAGESTPAGGRLDKAADIVGTILNHPLTWAAIGIATSGAGLAAKPYAGAALLAIRELRRRRRERKAGQKLDPPPDVPHEPYRPEDVTPQQPSITNHYPQTAPPIDWVNVDNGFYARAHDEARRVMGKRYPGSQEILEAELSLVQQFLSGQTPGPSTAPQQGAR